IGHQLGRTGPIMSRASGPIDAMAENTAHVTAAAVRTCPADIVRFTVSTGNRKVVPDYRWVLRHGALWLVVGAATDWSNRGISQRASLARVGGLIEYLQILRFVVEVPPRLMRRVVT